MVLENELWNEIQNGALGKDNSLWEVLQSYNIGKNFQQKQDLVELLDAKFITTLLK